jgi:hypothetical protein
MPVYKARGLSLALALIVAGPMRADDAQPTEPAVIVRLKSFDGLLADVKFLANVAGKAEEAKQIDGILQALPIKNGLAGTGLDTKRPFYFYAIATPDAISSHGSLMIPIADEKAFMSFLGDTLGNFGMSVNKGSDNIHSIGLPNVPFELFFTVADKYAYITVRDRDALTASRRIAAAKLAGGGDSTVASASIRLDRIPDMLKQMALSQFEVHVAEARDKKGPNETSAQTRLKLAVIDLASKRIKGLVRDGNSLDVALTIDRTSQDISWETNLTGKPGSELAKEIAGLAEKTSLFASSLAPAVNVGLNLTIPEELREAAVGAIKEGVEKAIQNEKDEQKRALAKKALDTLLPIVQAGQIDANLSVLGDSAGKYTVAFGMKVPDGAAIERLVKDDLVPTIPADKRRIVTLDAMTIGGYRVHRAVPPSKEVLSADERQFFGDSPTALIAFPENRVVFCIGADADSAIKSLLASKTAKAAAPFSATVSIMKIAPLRDPKRREDLEKVAKETFANAPSGSDLITLTVQGGPSLKVKWSAKAMGITFFTKVHELDH